MTTSIINNMSRARRLSHWHQLVSSFTKIEERTTWPAPQSKLFIHYKSLLQRDTCLDIVTQTKRETIYSDSASDNPNLLILNFAFSWLLYE
jgi:hypothetical protein